MRQSPAKKMSSLESSLIMVLITLLLVFSVLLVRNIQFAHKTGVFENHLPISELLLKHKQMNETSMTDIEYIDAWMTFQYINFIFDIPEDYLKKELSIEDPKYPNITLGKYIKNKGVNRTDFIKRVKEKVYEHMTLRSAQ